MKNQKFYYVITIVVTIITLILFTISMVDYQVKAEDNFIETVKYRTNIKLKSVNNHLNHNIGFVEEKMDEIVNEFVDNGSNFNDLSFLNNYNDLGTLEIKEITSLTNDEILKLENSKYSYNDDAYILILVKPIVVDGSTVGALFSKFDTLNYIDIIISHMDEFDKEDIYIVDKKGNYLYNDLGHGDLVTAFRNYTVNNKRVEDIIGYFKANEKSLIISNIENTDQYLYVVETENVFLIDTMEKSIIDLEQNKASSIVTIFLFKTMIITFSFSLFIIFIIYWRYRFFKQNELQIKALENCIMGGIVLSSLDKNLRILYCNDGFYSLVGYTKKEVVEIFDNSLSKMIYKEDLPILDEIVKVLPKSKIEKKFRLRTKFNEYIWVLLNFSCSPTEDKTVTIVLLDITESKTRNQEIKNLIASIPGGVLKVTSVSNTIDFASPSLLKMMGYTETEFREKFVYFQDLIFEEDREKFLNIIEMRPDNIFFDGRIVCKNGSILWITCNGNKTFDLSDKEIYQMVVINISKQISTSKKLANERHRMSAYLELTDEAIVEYIISEDNLVSTNKSCELLGFPQVIPNFYANIYKMTSIHPKDLNTFLEIYSDSKNILPKYQVDIRIKNKQNIFEWYNLKSTTLYEDGQPYKVITKLVNINEQRQRIEKLVDMSQRDSTTGLYNSGNIARIINEYLTGMGQAGNHSLIIFDIDDFKSFNDTYGHSTGDDIIYQFTQRLIEIFGNDNLIGRIGGDEFIVLYKNCNNKIISEVTNKFIKVLNRSFSSNGRNLVVTSSIGISRYPVDGTNYEELFKKADIACYCSKDKGKNFFSIFDKSMTSDSDVKVFSLRSSKTDFLITDIINSLGKTQLIIDGVKSALVILSKYFHFDYTYIFEYKEDLGEYFCSYSFDYKTETILEGNSGINSPISATLISAIKNGSILYINDIATLKEELPNLYKTMSRESTKSVLVSGVFEEGELKSLFTYGSYTQIPYPNQQEIAAIMTFTRLAISYIYRIKEKQNLSFGSHMFQAILKNQELSAYTVDINTLELLYISPRVKSLFPEMKVGTLCYKAFGNKPSQCATCPLRYIGSSERYSSHIFDEAYKKWLGITASKMEWENNKNAALIYSFDITSYIEKVSFKDSLTGLNNLSKFILEANNILKTKPINNYYLIATDIMDFSYINETLGYDKGNNLLIQVSEELNKEVRDNELCCRSHNDKFLLLLKSGTNTSITRRLMSFRKKCDKIATMTIGSTTSNFKSGIYVLKSSDREILEAINKAELALKSIEKSKEDFVFFSDTLLEEYSKFKEIENRMEYALINDEFKLFLQPIYNVKSNDIIGLEALTRWQIDETNIVFPEVFIPLFESNGFIEKMSYHMCEKICQTLKKWIDEGKEVVPIAINISYKYLISENFITGIKLLMNKYQIPQNLIEIELCETMFKEDTKLINKIVNQCYELGFIIAIDDFGSGYSSLISLKEFPLHIIKLDKGFLKEGKVSTKDIVILRNVINMGKELGIEVIAEGVETKEQLEILKSLDCYNIQGYYYSKPLKVEEIETILKKV